MYSRILSHSCSLGSPQLSNVIQTMQWRNGLSTGASTEAGVAATLKRNLSVSSSSFSNISPVPSTNLEGLLEVSASQLTQPESIYIPSQKLGMFRIGAEEKKNQSIRLDQLDAAKLKSIFAVTNSLKDSRGGIDGIPPSTEMETSEVTSHRGNVSLMIQRISAMNIPPLCPDMGSLCQPDGRSYSMYTEALDMGAQQDQNRAQWRPRENVLVATLWEHSNSVNKLAVSRDQSFFASASADKTVKVWQVNSLDKVAFPKSSLTYSEHRSPVGDLCIVENTHSIASCSDSGSIHLWRVELGSQLTSTHNSSSGQEVAPGQLGVMGSSVVKKVDPKEGALLGVQHFNSESASVLMYTTQKGLIHAWDLRSNSEPFVFPIRPELGMPTCLALAPDRNWIVAGTSRGYIGLWDIRFNTISKLWRHSSYSQIRRMACCKPIPRARSDIMQYTEGSYLFVAAGNNEVSMYMCYP